MSEQAINLQTMRDHYVARGVSNNNRNIAVRAKNATVTMATGKDFIDFAGAIGVMNVGHSHPKIVEALKTQAECFTHVGFNVAMYGGYIEVCKKLCEITPGNHTKKAILFNSGAEAVENAVKIARKHTKKTGVVSFFGAFHGRTNLTMTMTSKVEPYKKGFGPFGAEVYQAPFPNLYQRPTHMNEEEYIDYVIQQFDDFFTTTVSPQAVACVVMEPVQGEGGFIIPPKRFVQHVFAFCQANDILFVADEIQTGICRTGKTFAMEHFEVVPDLMIISKSLAAGMPLSAVVGAKEVLDGSSPGELGGTFAGNSLACAAALTVFDIIKDENLNEKSEKLGQAIETKAREWQQEVSFIGDIRRLGAMVALEIVKDEETKAPDADKTTKIIKQANDHGLLLLSAGIKSNVVRFLAPLTISAEELEGGLAILEQAIKENR